MSEEKKEKKEKKRKKGVIVVFFRKLKKLFLASPLGRLINLISRSKFVTVLKNSRFGRLLSKIFAVIGGAGKNFGLKKIKLGLVDYFIIGAITLGLGLLVYPTIGDIYSRWKTMQSIKDYDKFVDEMDEQEIEDEIQRARDYNRTLWGTLYRGIGEDDPDGSNYMKEGDERYNDILNVTKNGVIGYLIIDKINSYSTIYHGSTDSVLAAGVGHLFSTGFTVDGPNVHGALSAHTGLVSATLFTNLDQIKIGDSFEIHILNRVFTYQVDQILIVNPDDLSNLQIEYGSNYVTLITCYPYGINTHRLMVRGHLQGYTYDRDDYEDYFEFEQAVEGDSQEKDDDTGLENWEEEGEKLQQTGICWSDIIKTASTGTVITVMALLFYVYFKRSRSRFAKYKKSICMAVSGIGAIIMLSAGAMSLDGLIGEYVSGIKCQKQLQELKSYFENDDFSDVWEDAQKTDTENQITQKTDTENDITEEFDTENQNTQESDVEKNSNTITVDGRSYIGKLTLPSVNLELPVLSEYTKENIEIAPCVDMGSVESGRLVIAGHRYRRIFLNLKNVRIGDKIYITSAENKLYTYVVKDCVEILPRKKDLYYANDNWDLALYTCNENGRYRYVIYAELMQY